MIYPDVTVEEWINRHPSLSIETGKCTTCGNVLHTIIPFAERDWRGLLSPMCTCGREIGQLSTQYSPTRKLDNLIETLKETT